MIPGTADLDLMPDDVTSFTTDRVVPDEVDVGSQEVRQVTVTITEITPQPWTRFTAREGAARSGRPFVHHHFLASLDRFLRLPSGGSPSAFRAGCL